MTYSEKQKIADAYLESVCGLGWDDLADINSLHDAEDKQGVIDLCDERLADAAFPFSDLL